LLSASQSCLILPDPLLKQQMNFTQMKRLITALIFLVVLPVNSWQCQSAEAVYGGILPPARMSLSLHKFHVSNSQIEYNPTTQAAEIIIRVFADDFENALSKHAGRSVKPDAASNGRSQANASLILGYLNQQFTLKTKAGKPVKLTWIGLEAQADMYWLFLEGKIAGGMEGAQLRNRIHCELFDDQVNVVNTKFQGKQFGHMFEPQDEFKVITQK
jgi:hypothetical protein